MIIIDYHDYYFQQPDYIEYLTGQKSLKLLGPVTVKSSQ